MSILKISRLGHPILLQKCKLVKDITGDITKKIVDDMTETMLDAKGIGLAAPQVHINKQIIIFRDPDEDQEKEIKVTTKREAPRKKNAAAKKKATTTAIKEISPATTKKTATTTRRRRATKTKTTA